MDSLEGRRRRVSSRRKTKPEFYYDYDKMSLVKKRKRSNPRKSTSSISGCAETPRNNTTAATTGDDYFGEEDFSGSEYKLDFINKNDKEKVKETLRLYNAYYLRIAQLEEKRCGKEPKDDAKNAPKGSKPKQKKGNVGESSAATSGMTIMRPDLKTLRKMRETNTILYPQKIIGSFPGVDVGDHFLTRCEMMVIGLHDHWMNGIGYMPKTYDKTMVEERYRNYTFPLAVSVVLSGKYEDDLDTGDDVIYTGQGGNNSKGDCRQPHNQKMERGNLALQNNISQDVPVRFIRGHKSKSEDGKPVMTYTYDGLYKVVESLTEKGVSGFTVYKFHLKRLEGQPPLTTEQVTYCRGHVPHIILELRGLVCVDISKGEEGIPIPVTNLVDPPLQPTGFEYCKSMVLAENVKLPVRASGCRCEGKCTSHNICDCSKLNGDDFPYISSNGGRLAVAKSVIYECGPLCSCGDGCTNKSSQRGIKYRFEVFRTPAKGWAVRSWDFIPIGAPVCEYTGLLMRAEDLNKTDNADYMFDIDSLQTMNGLGGREKRIGDAATPSCPHNEADEEKLESSSEADEEKLKISAPEFCIDAAKVGNVARFINHSCEGNLFVQSVLSSHEDVKLARVVLFASENIPPLQELTYDYGYPIDGVLDADGKTRVIECHCGAANCKGRVC